MTAICMLRVHKINSTWFIDFSPRGQFAPWTFRTTLDISPHGRFAHRRFAPWTCGETSIDIAGRNIYGRPWGKTLWAKCPWGEMSSVGQNVYGRFAPRPWGKTSMGESPMGRSLVRGETPTGRIANGAKRNVHGANCPWGEKS